MSRIACYRFPSRPSAIVLGAVLLALPAGLLCAQDFDANLHPRSSTAASPERDQANAALESRDYALALKLLTPLAAGSPKDPQILYDLASAQDALEQTSPAEQSYRAALAADPAFLDAHVALGLLLARNAKFPEARTELLAATALPAGDKPMKARAFRALARIDQKSRPADARDELLEALKLSPETPEDTLLSAELAASAANGSNAAEGIYRRLLVTQPNDPATTAALAHLLVQQLRGEEAEKLLVSALAAHPGDPSLTAQLATLYSARGKSAEALPLLEQLHTANPHDGNVADLLAGVYMQTADYAHAEPLLAELTTRNPRDTSLIDDRARALIHLKRFAEAEEILAPIVAQPGLFPTPADLGNAAGDLAFASSSNGHPEQTLRALEIRAKILPTSAPALFLAAISHDKLHHTKLAQQAYRQFIEASKGANPDEEFEARHRLVTLEHMK